MGKADLSQFDYAKVAQLDADMWRAYYNHQFLKLFWQLLQLIKTQLGLSWPITIRLAYYSAWAAAYYRINKYKGVDNDRVLKNLIAFYKLISHHVVEPFDYVKAAEFELAWWDIHRKSTKNNKALEHALAEGAAAIYNVAPDTLTEYAHFRAEAMFLPRHEGDTQPVPTDWPEVAHLLTKAWRALHIAVQK